MWVPKEVIKEQIRLDFKYFTEFRHDPRELTDWVYRN